MKLTWRSLATTTFSATILSIFAASLVWSEPPEPQAPPPAVMEAIEGAAPRQGPEQVIVGAYINDIQDVDFKANNYIVDFYIWFRWRAPELDPSKTMEFMNRYASGDNVRERLYDKPMEMPDGSLYNVIRYQGRFSTKFPLENYPFDRQHLIVVIEDTVSSDQGQVFVPDGERPVMLDPVITLPGFTVGEPAMQITSTAYPTNFGDLTEPEAAAYSRITITVPVTRPVMAMSLKTFVPIALIVVCAALVFFVRPRYVEGRIGLGITALLTLVALQLTSGASLPDVDYLMMLDKIYLLAYLFVILSLARIVGTSWRSEDLEAEEALSRADRIWVAAMLAGLVLASVAVAWTALGVSTR